MLKPWHRFALATALGIAVGVSLAVMRVRGGLAAGQITNGPWATAKTYGTKDADALTRARVALSGLLALPAKEAMYFTAKTDSEGRPLDGRCKYAVEGKRIDGRWWSITVYDANGFLRANAMNRWSVGDLPLPLEGRPNVVDRRWALFVAPMRSEGDVPTLPSGGPGPFQLTLRVYQPSASLLQSPERAQLPDIVRTPC